MIYSSGKEMNVVRYFENHFKIRSSLKTETFLGFIVSNTGFKINLSNPPVTKQLLSHFKEDFCKTPLFLLSFPSPPSPLIRGRALKDNGMLEHY